MLLSAQRALSLFCSQEGNWKEFRFDKILNKFHEMLISRWRILIKIVLDSFNRIAIILASEKYG